MADVKAKVEALFAKYPVRHYDKGQIIIFAGDDPQYIFYITKGTVRMYDVTYRGDEVVLNVFKTGAFFPMSWAVNKTPNSYFYQAAEDVDIHIAPPDEALAFLQANSDVLFDLLQRVYRGTDGLLERMAMLMGGNARERLMLELLIEARRFSSKDINTFTLNITESELGSRAGLSRETVSRELSKLVRAGLVKMQAGKVNIPDVNALQQKLHS